MASKNSKTGGKGGKMKNKENLEPEKKTNRPAKLRGWSSESMVEAMKAVKEGQFGVNRAALEYGVPKTTLKDRLNSRVIHGTNMGPTPYLTYEEEKKLVRFILNCFRMGYGKTRGELLRIVGETMKKMGRLLVGSSVSQGWWSRFKERWPELSLRKGDAFSLAREKMTSAEVFNSYFNFLEETLKKYSLIEKPVQLYNCDESGMPLEHNLPKIIAEKGAKKVGQISSGNKTQITVLACCVVQQVKLYPIWLFFFQERNLTMI